MPKRPAILLLVSFALTACRGAVPETAPPPVQATVCAAASAAAEGRTEDAREGFDDAHAGLHALADSAQEHDRSAAADLLETKQQVEASPAATPGDYRALARAVERATGQGCGDG